MRQIEEDALHRRMFLQNAGDLRSVAATDVSQYTDAREIVGVENGIGFTTVDADHRCIEYLGLVGMFAQVFEDRLAKDFLEGDLSRSECCSRFLPRARNCSSPDINAKARFDPGTIALQGSANGVNEN